ncbi:MAG: sulfatase, partial [Halanaerobiales bacterium]
TGYRDHPNVKTPNLDRIAERGVDFTNAFANNPICSPSRICFMTGQYMHTHGMYGNDHAEYLEPNPKILANQFKRYGYETGLFGKAHLVRKWVDNAFETYRYTDLCDANRNDPTTNHYFKYLKERGLADYYEEGSPKPGQEYTMDGSAPAKLPYEHSIERFTGRETLKFLENRDESRPFFIHMSFQRPHAPIAPAEEYFDMYNPEDMVLPDNAYDYFENGFAGKPEFMQERLKGGCGYPLADPDPQKLKRCLASYYALISCIDMEIGKVLDKLEEEGELKNTVIVYVADHGDFAGEHGLFHKNFGIYDSIQKIPFLLSYPGGPEGEKRGEIVESVDLYSTLCQLCDIPVPEGREGISLIPIIRGEKEGKKKAFCEWDWSQGRISAIRTPDFRLVYYKDLKEGELYDHRKDPGETKNLWNHPDYREKRLELTEELLDFTLEHMVKTDMERDRRLAKKDKYSPVKLLHKQGRYWSDLKNAYEKNVEWPPRDND